MPTLQERACAVLAFLLFLDAAEGFQNVLTSGATWQQDRRKALQTKARKQLEEMLANEEEFGIDVLLPQSELAREKKRRSRL